MVGLDAAGKTTILYKLKLGEIVTTIPTIGEPGCWSLWPINFEIVVILDRIIGIMGFCLHWDQPWAFFYVLRLLRVKLLYNVQGW